MAKSRSRRQVSSCRLRLNGGAGRSFTALVNIFVKVARSPMLRANRVILAVLLGCGLRRSEVAALTFAHVQLSDGPWCIVDLVGKLGRVRTVTDAGNDGLVIPFLRWRQNSKRGFPGRASSRIVKLHATPMIMTNVRFSNGDRISLRFGLRLVLAAWRAAPPLGSGHPCRRTPLTPALAIGNSLQGENGFSDLLPLLTQFCQHFQDFHVDLNTSLIRTIYTSFLMDRFESGVGPG
jgi:hypothetical protein